MEWTKEKMDEAYAAIAAKVAEDPEFRKELVANPNAAIEKVTGLKVDPNYKIRIIEQDPAYQATFFLPAVTDEFSAAELDAAAGGSCGNNACGANGCAGQVTK